MKKTGAIVCIIFFLVGVQAAPAPHETHEVKIALYDSISPSVNLLEKAFRYTWHADDTTYEMHVTRIGWQDVMNGSLENYDVLVIGASGRQYFHGLFPQWRKQVKEFIRNGGGYVGICGGANMASDGYERPSHILDFLITAASLGLIDAHVNDDQNEEWQYLWKEEGRANIPIRHTLSEHPIFGGTEHRYLTYGGGPGLYGMVDAVSIATYDEEPMDKAPIHYWMWLGTWKPYRTIVTDIRGYHAAAETTYGAGKVIVYGAHPEIPPRMNGTVEEFFGFTIYGIPRYVYAWTGGTQQNLSYNWWMVRRSVAYVCSLPLPPVEELCVSLQDVQQGRIEAYAENAERVEFYVDGELAHVDEEAPFEMPLDNWEGTHRIKAVGYSPSGAEAWDERFITLA